MLNLKSIKSIDNKKFSKCFKKPSYDEYSFVQIIPTIEELLTGKKNKNSFSDDVLEGLKNKYNKVVLILIDGFGWNFFEKYKNDFPFLKKAVKNGVISKISPQFPSTTSAEITTINTNLQVNQHGVYEWQYFEPKLDEIIKPLMFSFVANKTRNTIKKTGISAKEIYPSKNFSKNFEKQGVKVYSFLNKAYLKTPYNTIVSNGMKLIKYEDWTDQLNKLQKKIIDKEKAYYFVYNENFDGLCHKFGPNSKEAENEIKNIFINLENFLVKIESKTKDTLMVLTADHGHTKINPKTTVYLNKIWPEIRKYIKRNKKNKLLVPAGGPRDMFLYVKEECLNLVKDKLGILLKDKAEIYKTEELLKKGFFGSKKASKVFLQRLGNLVILPYLNESVWWYKKGIFEQKYFGHHGGLSKEEMEIPLIFYPLGN